MPGGCSGLSQAATPSFPGPGGSVAGSKAALGGSQCYP